MEEGLDGFENDSSPFPYLELFKTLKSFVQYLLLFVGNDRDDA